MATISPASNADMRDDVAGALAIEEGLADVRAGRTVDGESVLRWLESWGTEREQRRMC